jgi:hypothetical protein
MTNHGSFSGNPKTEWLADEHGRDRNMQLLEDFSFTGPDNRIWPAPKNSVINGASIPQPLWSLVGSPYTDDYRRASVVHDVACGTPGVSRKEADVMFYHACRAGGCGPLQARILYAGVRIGAWAANNLPAEALSCDRLLFREQMGVQLAEERFLQDKLSDIAQDMEALPEEPSIGQMDAVIAQHLIIQPG